MPIVIRPLRKFHYGRPVNVDRDLVELGANGDLMSAKIHYR